MSTAAAERTDELEPSVYVCGNSSCSDPTCMVVGRDCNGDLISDDGRDDLRGRPDELASVADG